MAGVIDHAALVEAKKDVEAQEAGDEEQLRHGLREAAVAQEVRCERAKQPEDPPRRADGHEVVEHEARDVARDAGEQEYGRKVRLAVCEVCCEWACTHESHACK